MQKVASDLHQLSRQLGQIKVPKDALKTEHAQLRHEIDQYADAVTNAAGQDATGNKNMELPLIKIGAQVRLTFRDTGSNPRSVSAYDDISLTINNQ
jgi:prefoldin subunit 5